MPNYYPNYVNPSYASGYQAIANPPQPYGYSNAPSAPTNFIGIQWVDGEVGAKAFQLPHGWPLGTPIALWDTNDQIIYLKSFNQMGMPNPLQKIHYSMDESPAGYIQQSGSPSDPQVNYATKEDLESFKNEIKEMLKNRQPNNNRGGNT